MGLVTWALAQIVQGLLIKQIQEFSNSIYGLALGAGMMSQYGSGWKPSENKGLLELLLQKSASLQGFFLPQHARRFKEHLNHLATLWTQGKLRAEIDTSHFM